MNKKLIIFVVILVILTVIISWKSFEEFSNKKLRLVTNLEIYLQNNTDIASNDENNVSNFKIVNRSEVPIKYEVIISDNSNDKDGIPRKALLYELVLDGKTIKSGRLSDIKDNVLLKDNIESDVANNYTFKITVDDSVDLDGKNYQYDLKVQPVMR